MAEKTTEDLLKQLDAARKEINMPMPNADAEKLRKALNGVVNVLTDMLSARSG